MSILGLHVGVSFAELSLLTTPSMESLAHQRVYLPRLPLKTALQKFINKHADANIEKIFFISNHIDKLAPFRLGGSTAHLVTEGRENVAWLSQNSCEPFRLTRPPAVQSQELVFAVKERMSSTGTVLEPLDEDQIRSISAKLKLMDVKRVCLHFLHSQKNSTHVNKAKEILAESGFEVYIPDFDSDLEIEKSRRLSVNAGLMGTWEDFKNDIKAAMTAENLNCPFYVLEGHRFKSLDDEVDPLEALSSLDSFWQLIPHKNVVYFGFETFYQIFPQARRRIWQSPWGSIYRDHAEKNYFSVQPTSSISVNFWNELDFTSSQEGFEPGPIALGRGQKLTAFDLFFDELSDHPDLKDWISSAAGTKISSSLNALAKGSKNSDRPLSFDLKTNLLHQLHMEMIPHEEKPEYFGFWTKFLNPVVSKQRPPRPLSDMVARVGQEQA